MTSQHLTIISDDSGKWERRAHSRAICGAPVDDDRVWCHRPATTADLIPAEGWDFEGPDPCYWAHFCDEHAPTDAYQTISLTSPR